MVYLALISCSIHYRHNSRKLSLLIRNSNLEQILQCLHAVYKTRASSANFTTQDDELHKHLKTPIAQLYNLSNVITFEPFVDDVLGLLFQQLDKRFTNQNKICNLGNWIQYFALDVMGEISFSARYGFLETGTDMDGIVQSIWNFMLTVGPLSAQFIRFIPYSPQLGLC